MLLRKRALIERRLCIFGIILCFPPAHMSEWMEVVQSCLTLWDSMDLYSKWNSPGQNTGVGSLSLLHGIFPTQGLNPHCRRILYQLSHQGNPRILEWVAYAFSSGSSRLRNQTGVSWIAGRFFTNRATREVHINKGKSSCFLQSEWQC